MKVAAKKESGREKGGKGMRRRYLAGGDGPVPPKGLYLPWHNVNNGDQAVAVLAYLTDRYGIFVNLGLRMY